MTRRGYRAEQRFPLIILDVLPYDAPGLTWTEISKRVKEIGTETLSKYLKQLVSARMVLHEGKFYRRNPTSGSTYDAYRRVLMEDLPAFSADSFFEYHRSHQLRKIFDWSNEPIDISPFGLNTANDVLLGMRMAFGFAFNIYLHLLRDIVDMSSKTTARECVDLVMKVQIESVLVSLAHSVWENREKIRLKEVDLDDALYHFMTGSPQMQTGQKPVGRIVKR